MLGATAKNLGAQSYSVGDPGYWASVRQQHWDGLLFYRTQIRN